MQPQPTPAEAYQEYFAPAIFEPLANELFGRLSPQPGDRVLDIACGTGVVSRRAAAMVGPGGQVVGVDINPGMVAVAQSQPGVDSVAIEFRQGDAQALDLPDGSYDVVYCQQGVQFFPDRAAGLRQMRRVLRDGGRVALAVWHGLDRQPLYPELTEAELPYLNTFGTTVTKEDLVAPFSLGDQDELVSLLAGAGFQDIDLVSRTVQVRFAEPDQVLERIRYAYAAVVPRFVEDPAAFATYLKHINEDATAVVERYRDGDWVVYPMHTHIAVARA